MSFTNLRNSGFRVSSAIIDGATESAASLSRGVRMVVLGMLSTATNTSLIDKEPSLVTWEEVQQAERKFLDNSIIGDVDCDFCGDQGCVYCDSDDFEPVSTDIVPTGFFPFDTERVVEDGKRDLHQVMYHLVMHLSARNHPVMGNREFMTKMSEIIGAWYFTSPEEAFLRWTDITMLLSQHSLINFDDPTDDVLILLRRRY